MGSRRKMTKRDFKDSIFEDPFGIKENVSMLCREPHPGDTASTLEDVPRIGDGPTAVLSPKARDQGLNHWNSKYLISLRDTLPSRISFFTPPDSLTVLETSDHVRIPPSSIAWTRYLAWQSSGEEV